MRTSFTGFKLCVAAASLMIVPAWGQPVSVGVIGGVPITDAFETFRGNSASYATNTKRYVVGPTVQLHLPLGFGAEVDALYRRLGYQYDAISPGAVVTAKTVANSWEFPVLGTFTFPTEVIRPFVKAGASFRNVSGVRQIRNTINTGLSPISVELNNATEFNKRNDVGFTIGAGVELKFGRLRIGPEFRYTRWGGENFRDPVAALLRTNRNQGDFLLGITF